MAAYFRTNPETSRLSRHREKEPPESGHGVQDFVARHAGLFRRQGGDDVHVGLRLGEDRLVEPRKLPGQFRARREEETVDVLRQAPALLEKAPVIRSSAERHVGRNDLLPVHRNPLRVKELLAFAEREGLQVDRPVRAVEETAAVLEDFLRHPRRRASADHHHDVLPRRGPSVPERLHGLDEPGVPGVHPREFVDEDRLARVAAGRQCLLQGLERLHPVPGPFAVLVPLALEGAPERVQLFGVVAVLEPGVPIFGKNEVSIQPKVKLLT